MTACRAGRATNFSREAQQGRLQVGGTGVVLWALACCRLIPAMAREPAEAATTAAEQLGALSALLLGSLFPVMRFQGGRPRLRRRLQRKPTLALTL